MRRVASLAGLPPAYVQRLRNGRNLQVRASVAQRLLALRATPAPSALRSPGRARQLLRWCLLEGFTLAALALRIGLDRHTIACRRAAIQFSTELTLSAFHRTLTE